MKEITRIHLAKSSYDIELAAKKQLEHYINSLETYAQDKDVMVDIEIRMTELLEARGVKTNGVISSDDVKAVREQLGEPHEFASEESDMALGPVGVANPNGRKFFRDGNGAVLGGVLAGIAAYTRINVAWIRLAFIILTIISLGTALLVYALLWIVVPLARTAAEKLTMKGEPVTLESIKRLNMSEELVGPNRTSRFIVRTLLVLTGIFAIIGALLAIVAVIGVIGYTIFGYVPFDVPMNNAFFWATLILAGLAGLLLAALLSLVAYAAFTGRVGKRIVVSAIVVTISGILAFSAAFITGAVGTAAYAQHAQSLVREQTVALPDSFRTITALQFEKNDVSLQPEVEYVVDSGVPRYVLSSLPGTKVTVAVNGDTATVKVHDSEQNRTIPYFAQTKVTIYGPAVTQIKATDMSVRYQTQSQEKVVVIGDGHQRTSISGTINSVETKGRGEVDVSTSSVTSLTVDSVSGSSVVAGTVRNLVVTQPDVCPDQESDRAIVSVRGVSSGVMTYNGSQREATSNTTACAKVIIGEEEQY